MYSEISGWEVFGGVITGDRSEGSKMRFLARRLRNMDVKVIRYGCNW